MRSIDVRAPIMTGPRATEDWTLSVPVDASDVGVRVELCGICTPEQRVYKGTKPTYPYWGGHELSGTVAFLPQESRTELQVGDRVAILLMRRCGECRACRSGLDNHCAYLHPEARSGLPQGPGGFADLLAVPAYKVFAVPQHLPAGRIALIEPVACVSRGVGRARAKAGETVAVIGGGTMGLLHTILLAIRGCAVHVFDDDEVTHGAALAAGATAAGPLSQLSDPKWVEATTDGWGFDCVFCTRFGADAVTSAIAVAARGARIVLYQSIPDTDQLSISANFLHYREIELIGSVAQSAADVAAAIDIMGRRHDRFDALNIEIMPASSARDAFERALDPRVNRVMIDFR
ncbi:medium chain dehydrogenase/reductase family protein [Mesorhizobium sp. KR9-304]|uniref:zinc-dependent alcohol dehydrogenase n=1 Tax=Mesorhizobium sp. KR9-304 TaxID=3156614 RepID=UPI0032B34B66